MTESVLGFVQVHLHAPLGLVQTGEMTQSQAKMFTGRCVLKELSLAGHGSGKYPAVRCICNSLLLPIPPTKSWPLKKWWMSWPCYCFCPFLIFFLPFFFSIPLKIEALSMLSSEAISAPVLLTVSNHFKVWCRLRPEPFGTWLLCSGSRQELRFVICRWHEQCLACGCWGAFVKAKSVMCNMMWLVLHITTADKGFQLVSIFMTL